MPAAYESALAKKLNVKSGTPVRIVGAPSNVDLPGIDASEAAEPDGVIVFVRTLAELATMAAPAFEAARADRIAWIAYPKAGRLETDLNRDILAREVTRQGIRPVRQVAIDDTWSALRFRGAG